MFDWVIRPSLIGHALRTDCGDYGFFQDEPIFGGITVHTWCTCLVILKHFPFDIITLIHNFLQEQSAWISFDTAFLLWKFHDLRPRKLKWHLKKGHFKRKVVFQPLFFWVHVSFRGRIRFIQWFVHVAAQSLGHPIVLLEDDVQSHPVRFNLESRTPTTLLKTNSECPRPKMCRDPTVTSKHSQNHELYEFYVEPFMCILYEE